MPRAERNPRPSRGPSWTVDHFGVVLIVVLLLARFVPALLTWIGSLG
jgi:hypothetical protein